MCLNSCLTQQVMSTMSLPPLMTRYNTALNFWQRNIDYDPFIPFYLHFWSHAPLGPPRYRFPFWRSQCADLGQSPSCCLSRHHPKRLCSGGHIPARTPVTLCLIEWIIVTVCSVQYITVLFQILKGLQKKRKKTVPCLMTLHRMQMSEFGWTVT